MKLQLDGYMVEIERMYIYKAYAGLLCGMIDSKINNRQEIGAKKELKAFSYVENANLYMPPKREKALLSSFHSDMQEVIKEDYLMGLYDSENFPEEHLSTYWVVLELISYDEHLKKEDGLSTGLNIACNLSNFDIPTIEKYLYENLSIEIWSHRSIDYTF